MKKAVFNILTMLIGTGIILAGCEEDNSSYVIEDFVGTWIESEPDKYEGISDTIVFNGKGTVEKNFRFENWEFEISNNLLTFILADDSVIFEIEAQSKSEFVIKGFVNRSIDNTIRNIRYKKIETRCCEL